MVDYFRVSVEHPEHMERIPIAIDTHTAQNS